MTQALPNVSAIDASNYPRHRWYFFKEAFSPAIVEHAIVTADLKKNATVVDPFSGSGTTPLTATISGFRGSGIEVNPFLRFVAETKTLQAPVSKFNAAVKKATAASKSKNQSPLEIFSTFSEHAPAAQKREKWLFNSEILRAFSGAWAATSTMSGATQKLVRLCLIGAAMDASNAVKDGKCLRYKKGWQLRKFDRSDFLSALSDRAKIVEEDLEAAPLKETKSNIAIGDSRKLVFSEQFDLCVTSPPYLNSFDYTDVYRPELFLGGFVRTMEDLRQLRHSTLRSHVQTKWIAPVEQDFGTYYTEAMSELRGRLDGLWNARLPEMVQAYFEDMGNVLLRLRSKAKRHASLSLVVSTSSYAGVEIPVDLIIADIAQRSGWFLHEVVVLRHLKRVSCQQWDELSDRVGANGPHLRESMVVIDAQPRR